jgi:hypothetical protein
MPKTEENKTATLDIPKKPPPKKEKKSRRREKKISHRHGDG